MVSLLLVLVVNPPCQGCLYLGETVQGRSSLLYRSLTLIGDRPGTIVPGQNLPKGTLFASWKVGSVDRQSYPVAWNAAAKTLFIDMDRDGSFSAKEKWILGPNPIEIPIKIDNRPRVALIRVRDDDPLIAVRGFIESKVIIEGKPHMVYLLDGNADGCFDQVGTDRIWLDKNGDGLIDPLVEMFPVGSGIDFGGILYLLKPTAMGEKIEVFRRPKETGNVGFTLIQGGKAQPSEMIMNLVSEWGEWVQIKQIGKSENLPVGRYRVVDLEFQLHDGNKESWSYHFYSTGSKFEIEVRSGKKTTYELLPQLKLHFQVDPFVDMEGGMVKPWIAAGNSLTMDWCNKGTPSFFGRDGEKPTFTWTGEKATIRLNEVGSLKLDEQNTGFS